MIKQNSFVIYKNTLAIVKELDTEKGDKFTVEWQTSPETQTGKKAQYATQKVREKDVKIFINDEIFSMLNDEKISLEKALQNEANSTLTNEYAQKIEEVWSLLASDNENPTPKISFAEIIQLCYSKISINELWAFYTALTKNTKFFKELDESIIFQLRSEQEISDLEKKENEKSQAEKLQEEFIERLKQKNILLPNDSQFMQEIESFALGKTEKSKYLQLAGFSQKIEKAHKLLLDTGFWQITKNPYPSRYGLSMSSAKESLPPPPDEQRVEILQTAYAIDNETSDDPDDAVSFDGGFVWIPIADPAATVLPDSKIDIDARKRGTTLYMPEGISRMISEDSLTDYALGLQEKSPALSFKIKLDENANIIESDVLKTIVHVKRLTYKQAEEMQDSAELKDLFRIAKLYRKKRDSLGAVTIELPQVDVRAIKDEEGKISVEIQDEQTLESKEMIKEMMLMAGEGASKFAFKNNIPFPYISTDKIDLPKSIPEGLAGQYALRKCMKGRHVSVTPSMHCSLGLSTYCQVTSPLRRYIDLIAHQQLRAFLKGEKLISKDDVLERISTGDAGISAANKASRESELHFKLVYLLQNPNWEGKAICVDFKQNLAVFLIPSLAMETQILNKSYKLNDEITVRSSNINLPELKADFVAV